MHKKNIMMLIVSVLVVAAVTPARAEIIIADHFDMAQDWSGNTARALAAIQSTDRRGTKWASIGVQNQAVIDRASGHSGRGLRFEVGPGDGKTTIGAEMAGYPQKPWQGRSQYIGYYSKISDNDDWGTKGKTLKMLRINMEKNDVIPLLEKGTYAVFIGTRVVFDGIYRPDDKWHKYVWEFTAQSNPDEDDGAIRLWVDDAVKWERTDVKWNSYGTIKEGTHFNYGFNGNWYYVFIQGNLSATYNGPTKYLYWDDFIVATSKKEVDDFMGGKGSSPAPTTNPAPEVSPSPKGPADPAPPPPRPARDRSPSAKILLQEDFEDANLSGRGWFDSGARNALLVTDVARGRVLQYSYNAGASTPTTGALRKQFPESDDVTVSYYIKYQPGWQWTGLGYGPHEIYLLSNQDSPWIGPAATHLTTYLESIDGKQAVVFQDALNIDQARIDSRPVSATERRGLFGCNGSSDSHPEGVCWGSDGAKINGKTWKSSKPAITTGVWHGVKVHLKMNSIVNGVGVADGVIQYWLDGVPQMNHRNVMIRTGANPNLKWSTLMIGPYFHNGAKQEQKFWIDDLRVTTGLISGPTPTGAPTVKHMVK